MTIKLSPRAMNAMQELIPAHMHSSLVRYFERGCRPGDFLTAVLANDLHGALAHADDINKHALHGYHIWLYNYVPGRPNGWGSYEAVTEYVAEAYEEIQQEQELQNAAAAD